jgi:fatty acid desaturase
MTLLCPYRHSLGKENEGIHSYRLFDLAIVDVIMTIVGAFFIAYIFEQNFIIVFIILMLMAILLHYIFNVNTTINKIIFGYVKPC